MSAASSCDSDGCQAGRRSIPSENQLTSSRIFCDPAHYVQTDARRRASDLDRKTCATDSTAAAYSLLRQPPAR